MKKPRRVTDDDQPTVELAISPDTVCFLIVKAREFDAKEQVTEPDPGSNPTDDGDAAVLEDHGDDPVVEEIVSAIFALGEDEKTELVALAWLGRGDGTVDDWESLKSQAAEEHTGHTARYLIGMPQLGDYLEEGLALLGRDCVSFEADQL